MNKFPYLFQQVNFTQKTHVKFYIEKKDSAISLLKKGLKDFIVIESAVPYNIIFRQIFRFLRFKLFPNGWLNILVCIT